MNAMRHTVAASKMREGSRLLSSSKRGGQESEMQESLGVDWKEALYLATRGGALALGLPRGSGIFEVGAPFDAQCSQFTLVFAVALTDISCCSSIG